MKQPVRRSARTVWRKIVAVVASIGVLLAGGGGWGPVGPRDGLGASVGAILGTGAEQGSEVSHRPGVKAEAGPDLRLGVNLSHWFWLPHDASPEGQAKYFTAADAARLKADGFSHARVPFEPRELWDDVTHGLREGALQRYKAGIELLTSAGVVAIVDAHPNSTPWANPKSASSEKEYPLFWKGLAGAFAASDPMLVVFEVMNEPHDLGDAPSVLHKLQSASIAAIREVAPRHTIIVTGDEWGSIKGLLRLEPTAEMLADTRLVYSFHFYEPGTFTHQGATWGAPNWKHLRKIPYPATEARLKVAEAATQEPAAKGEVTWYGKQNWDAEKIRSELHKAVKWGEKHGVPIYCGEFGVYAAHSERADRLAWMRDVSTPLREWGVGYAAWDYAGGFAVYISGEQGRRLDAEVGRAIGLGGGEAGGKNVEAVPEVRPGEGK